MQQHDSQRREQVLQLLVTHRSDIVTGILAQVRDFTVAEELFQEVALVVAKQWQDFEPGTNFLAWARQIARNKIIAFHRERRRPEFQFSPEALASIESAGDRRSAIQNHLDHMRDCLSQLGDKGAALISMRYRKGYDCERIAKESGTTVANVYMMLSRIRTRLADCIRSKQAKEMN